MGKDFIVPGGSAGHKQVLNVVIRSDFWIKSLSVVGKDVSWDTPFPSLDTPFVKITSNVSDVSFQALKDCKISFKTGSIYNDFTTSWERNVTTGETFFSQQSITTGDQFVYLMEID